MEFYEIFMRKNVFAKCIIVFFALSLMAGYSLNQIDIHQYEQAVNQMFPHKKGKISFENVSKNSLIQANHKQVFEIACDNKRYIVRIFNQRDTIKKKGKEIQMAQMVSKAGFGPLFVGAPKNNEFYIVEFAGRGLKYKDLSNELLIKIGQILRKIHEFKFFENAKTQQDRLKKHYKECLKKNVALPSDFEDVYTDYLKQNTNSVPQIGFCHGNLNPRNIRINDDGGIILINWKNAGNGDIFEDIGYFVLTNGLDDDQIAVFMESYLGRTPNKDDIAKVQEATNKTCLLTATIWFQFSENKKDKKIPIAERIRALDEMSVSGNLKNIADYPRIDQIPSVLSKNKDEVKAYAVSAWKQYKLTLAPEDGVFSKIKKWINNLF